MSDSSRPKIIDNLYTSPYTAPYTTTMSPPHSVHDSNPSLHVSPLPQTPQTSIPIQTSGPISTGGTPAPSPIIDTPASPSIILTHQKIWVTFAKVGYHRYPNAPEEVSYLQSVHRHLFKFKVTVAVTHDDREIEFHMFLKWCEDQYRGKGDANTDAALILDYKSCEMIARDLLHAIVQRYGSQRFVEVEVSEDGECGAVVTFTGNVGQTLVSLI